MSRAGVDKDRAEWAIGHVIGGARRVYDRHEFVVEKRRALKALAALIERIRNPRENVIPLKADASAWRGPLAGASAGMTLPRWRGLPAPAENRALAREGLPAECFLTPLADRLRQWKTPALRKRA
jgi:hypothetical protein